MKDTLLTYLKVSKKTLFIIAFLYVGFVVILYAKQRDFIYFPDKRPIDLTILNGSGYAATNVDVTTVDQLNIHGWFFAPSPKTKKVILFLHGNAGNISHRLFKIEPYLRQGYGILLAEYRGYGGNPGTPDEQGLYADARAYLSWLEETGYKAADIIVYGESLGTGVAVQIAKEFNPDALILETPYADFVDPAEARYFFIPFVKHLLHDRFSSAEKIENYLGPKLFMVAGKDEVLGPQTGLKLFAKAQEPKTLKLFEEAGHNNLYNFNATDTVLEFLESLPRK